MKHKLDRPKKPDESTLEEIDNLFTSLEGTLYRTSFYTEKLENYVDDLEEELVLCKLKLQVMEEKLRAFHFTDKVKSRK